MKVKFAQFQLDWDILLENLCSSSTIEIRVECPLALLTSTCSRFLLVAALVSD